jgi:hypothetical protein
MAKAEWIAEVGKGREVAGFIGESAVKYKDFFTARVIVAVEAGTGVVAHDRRRMAALGFFTRQRLAPNAGFRAWHPLLVVGIDHDALAEIHVQHGELLVWFLLWFLLWFLMWAHGMPCPHG